MGSDIELGDLVEAAHGAITKTRITLYCRCGALVTRYAPDHSDKIEELEGD